MRVSEGNRTRRAARLAFALALGASLSNPATAVRAEEVLVCGTTVTRELAPGASDTYRYAALDRVVIDAVDVSGTIGLLKLHYASDPIAGNGVNNGETCSPSLTLEAPAAGTVVVSSCLGEDGGQYAISLTPVGPGSDGCGDRPLRCGEPLPAGIDVPGEVDSYSFTLGDDWLLSDPTLTIEATDLGANLGAVRLRLFGEHGFITESCSGILSTELRDQGSYTILASACDGLATGSYKLKTNALACPPSPSRRPLGEGPYAYVVDANRPVVKVVDAQGGVVEIRLGQNDDEHVTDHEGLVTGPNGAFAYVVVRSIPAVSVIGTATNEVVATIPAPWFGAMATSPDGSTLFVTSNGLHGVMLIDTATNRQKGFIPVGAAEGDLAAIAVRPDAAVLYISDPPFQKVWVVDVVSKSVIGSIPGAGDESVAFDPTGTFAYATAGDGILRRSRVIVIDAISHTETTSIDLTGLATGIAFAPSGNRAYVAVNYASATVPHGSLAVIDTATHQVIGGIPVPGTSFGRRGVAISPDGKMIYVSYAQNYPGDLAGMALIDSVTNQVRQIPFSIADTPTDVAIADVPQGLCTADAEGESKVTIGELITAVNYALDGCPGSPPLMSVAP